MPPSLPGRPINLNAECCQSTIPFRRIRLLRSELPPLFCVDPQRVRREAVVTHIEPSLPQSNTLEPAPRLGLHRSRLLVAAVEVPVLLDALELIPANASLTSQDFGKITPHPDHHRAWHKVDVRRHGRTLHNELRRCACLIIELVEAVGTERHLVDVWKVKIVCQNLAGDGRPATLWPGYQNTLYAQHSQVSQHLIVAAVPLER